MRTSKKKEDEHNRVVDIMFEALHKIGSEGISQQNMMSGIVDFVASLGLMPGEEGLRAVIARLEHRIDDWRAGRFLNSGCRLPSRNTPAMKPL